MNGRLAIALERQPGQFLADGCTVVVDVDGYRYPRTWGNHLLELVPGNHQISVWFEYMLTRNANRATAVVPIYAGYDTFVRYRTATFVFSSGSLVVVGQQPFPAY